MRAQCLILIVAAFVPFTCAIINGTLADISSFPSQVVIYIKEYGLWGGGTLIATRWVVSSADLFYGFDASDASAFLIRAGSNFFDEGGATSDVVKFIPHPKFRKGTSDNDIAMLKLTNGFPQAIRNQYPIGFAALPNEPPADTSEVWVTGWGTTVEFGNIPHSRELLKISIKIVPRDLCNRVPYLKDRITPRMICAGRLKGGKDKCGGDEGGPMLQNGTLVGITSWGVGCGHCPSVYTNVAVYTGWIEEIMKKY